MPNKNPRTASKRTSKTRIDDNITENKPKKRRTKNDSKTDLKSDSKETQMSPSLKTLNKLSVDFFANKSCIELSKALLGKILCRRLTNNGLVLKGKIVETEAYLGGEDRASITYGGRRSEANEPLFMKAGTCYVYMTYGMYHCFNISAQGEGAGVLLRAVQPIEQIDCMRELRAKSRKVKSGQPFKTKELANGPSKLCMAFDINKKDINKVDITDSPVIWIEEAESVTEDNIVADKRIGITRAGEWNDKLLRFYVKDCEFVSQYQ